MKQETGNNWESNNIKSNKPETYDGRKYFLIISMCLFNFQQYLSLFQLESTPCILNDNRNISLASSYPNRIAAVWWFHPVTTKTVPFHWTEFRTALIHEFVPVENSGRARDKLRTIKIPCPSPSIFLSSKISHLLYQTSLRKINGQVL